MKVRRILAAIAAGSIMLLGAGAGQATAAEYATTVLGRKLVTYTSGTSKWVASAQGEFFSAYSPKGEQDALRGRAAVQEKAGLKRVRIYDVKLQRYINGAWQTVAVNLTDKISESASAYAVSYTPPRRVAPFGYGIKRTYRVVNTHGVRRNDGVVVNRTTYSANFQAQVLEDDPLAPIGGFNAGIVADTENWVTFETRPVHTIFAFIGAKPTTIVDDVVAKVNFNRYTDVDTVPAGFRADTSTADENDYVLGPERWTTTNGTTERDLTWTIHPVVPGGGVTVDISISAPRALGGQDSLSADTHNSSDIQVEVELGGAPDVWPDYPGLQLYPGDVVVWKYTVRNGGPQGAEAVKLYDALDDRLGPIEKAWFEGGDPAPCVPTPDWNVTCDLRYMDPGETKTVYVQTHIKDDANFGWASDLAWVESSSLDPNSDNDTAYAGFEIVQQ
jgi:hypothetical protein